LLGSEATRIAIIKTLEQQSLVAGLDGLLLVHFSGHGDVDPHKPDNAYLLPVDADPQALGATAIPLEDLAHRHLGQVQTALILLDCCHSGYTVGLKGAAIQADLGREFGNQARNTFGNVKGRIVLAACAGKQKARELAFLEHGVFTYYALEHWRTSTTDVDDLSLSQYVSRMLERTGLPTPVRGGVQQGRIVLREGSSASTPANSKPPASQPNLLRRDKLYSDIAMFNDEQWRRLLFSLGIGSNALPGRDQSTKIRNLISAMDSTGHIEDLDLLVRTQTERKAHEEAKQRARTNQQICDLLSQLITAEFGSSWNRVIKLGEDILKLDPDHQSARSKTAEAYKARGELCRAEYEYEEAISNFTRAIELAPYHADYYRLRGKSYHHMAYAVSASILSGWDRDRKAISYYRHGMDDLTRAIELEPYNGRRYYDRGLAYRNLLVAARDSENALRSDSSQFLVQRQTVHIWLSYRDTGLYTRRFTYDAAKRDFLRAAQLGYVPAISVLIKTLLDLLRYTYL
jgi:tetratricopeptide (TPR) repeat protein